MTELRLREAALRATARLSLRAAAARASPTGARRCYTSSGDPQYAMANRLEKRGGDMRLDKSFDSQVSGSITARLKREAEKRDRYERWREATDPSRKWMTTIFVLGSAGFAYWLGTFWPREPDPRSTLPLDDARAPELNTKLENMSAAWTDFIKLLGKEYVSTHEADIKWHMGSAWSTHQPQPDEKPFCIVFPGSTEEVAQVMKICHRRKIPVVGYSGGTSLEGNYAQTRKGICINFSRMDEIVALHKDDLDVVVQPGVRWEELNRELEKDGLFFPLDPGPNAMIGGMVGTGCSGTNAYRYGTMREWVISLTVVLADGTILKTRQRPRKSSAGYDLTRLFVGSEGTLGLVTEATLKLAVKPEATSVAVCSFPTIRHAANCVSKVVGQAVPIAAVEILDDKQIQFINAAGSTSRSWAEEPTLFFKFSGTPSGVKESVEQVQKLAKTSGGKKFEFARSKNEQDELWSARKEALWSTMAMAKEGHRVWTGDVAVPISMLPDLIEQTQEDIRKSGLVGSIVGHAADGNFHTLLMYSKVQRAKAERVVHNMVRRAIDMEGTVTGEHGVGLIKRDYLPLELGDAAVDLMRQIKMALDPLCLLNCDKVIRIQRPKRGEVKDLKPEA